MLKQQQQQQQPLKKPKKNTTIKKNPLTSSKRTKTWKRHQERREDGRYNDTHAAVKKGHLAQVLHDRKLVREHLTSWGQIVPKPEWRVVPTKQNGWAVEDVHPMPRDLHRRILSYADQFDTPIRPKQIIKHFVEHPTQPVRKDHVYAMMEQLHKYGNMRKYTKTDEEGVLHWFTTTTNISRVKHNVHLKELIRKKLPLPLDEVVWETFGNQADSYANLREITPEQREFFETQKKLDKAKEKAAKDKAKRGV
jgi:hypothetical protein